MEELTLFGENSEALKPIKRSRKEVFEGYDEFLDKFQTKKTTDDCFTPAPVYDAVVRFISEQIRPIGGGTTIVRPFYPGGDYEAYEYPENCVVIDNPPFSILSRICRFYSAHRVPFFLWAPALTLFTAPDCDLTYIIADSDITYENGAVVRTGFITNMCPDIRVWCCPDLKKMIEDAQAVPSKVKKGFVYPDNIITAATIGKITAHGVEFKVLKKACAYIRDSDSAKAQGRSLFGGGFLLSDRAAAERAAAERAAAERAAAERAAAERAAAERAAASRLGLSPREKQIIDRLNDQY